jgi:hypothetical protein
MALEERNYVGNLDVSQRAGGFVSVLHSKEWFERAIADEGVHVAQSGDGKVSGFIAVTAPPEPGQVDLPPIVRSLLERAAELEYRGQPITEQKFAVRGPVVIDPDARGHGVYSMFNAAMHEFYRQRFDIGVLFVAADNPRSFHTTTTKLGASPIGTFEAEGRLFHLLAFDF